MLRLKWSNDQKAEEEEEEEEEEDDDDDEEEDKEEEGKGKMPLIFSFSWTEMFGNSGREIPFDVLKNCYSIERIHSSKFSRLLHMKATIRLETKSGRILQFT